jgi:hypothetical protein
VAKLSKAGFHAVWAAEVLYAFGPPEGQDTGATPEEAALQATRDTIRVIKVPPPPPPTSSQLGHHCNPSDSTW